MNQMYMGSFQRHSFKRGGTIRCHDSIIKKNLSFRKLRLSDFIPGRIMRQKLVK